MALSLLVFVVEVVHLASSLLSSVASSELVVSMLCMSVMFIPYDNRSSESLESSPRHSRCPRKHVTYASQIPGLSVGKNAMESGWTFDVVRERDIVTRLQHCSSCRCRVKRVMMMKCECANDIRSSSVLL